MTAPRLGDRVHVEYDGVVTRADQFDGSFLDVRADGGPVLVAHVDYCTVIAPPVKVGDLVTAENVEQIARAGTVVCTASGRPRWHDGLKWRDSAANPVSGMLGIGCAILRIGDGS